MADENCNECSKSFPNRLLHDTIIILYHDFLT